MQNKAIKEQRLQKMAEEIEDYAIILMDEEGNIESWNKGAEKIKGYIATEIIGQNFRVFYTPEAREEGRPEMLLSIAREKGSCKDEGWRVRKDGTRFWCNIVITAIHDDSGEVIGFTKVTKDFTQQKLAADNLRKSEERYHQMVNDVEDYAILMLDPIGNVVNWNKGAENIKGYKAEEIIGKSFRLFYREEDRLDKLPDKLLAKAVTNGRAQHEGWRVRKDGTHFWGNVTITTLFGENNEIVGFSKVTRDLTDRKKAETAQLLEIRNKELEEFAYVASHDLQAPIATIKALIGLLRTDIADSISADSLAFLELIDESLERMEMLIKDLLDYSLLGKNRVVEKVDCYELLEMVIKDLRVAIKDSQASIEIGKLPTINGFKTELRQLFQNLIINAIKFRQPDISPIIQLSAREGYGHWFFEIRDNGIGMDPQYFDRIFRLFQRLHDQDKYDGTGIGLANCKKIVEMHDGKIWVESELGKGSTFYFTLSKL